MTHLGLAILAGVILSAGTGLEATDGPHDQMAPKVDSKSSASKPDWQDIATDRDVERLLGWRSAFVAARTHVLANENRDKILAGGKLYEVDSAIGYEPPPAGLYKCNTTKLAGQFLDFIAYDYFWCRVFVEGGRRQFVKLTGSQRPVGYIYDAPPNHEGDTDHGVFLGALVLGDEEVLVPYGTKDDRDEAGRVQRLAENRWRMVFPKPFYEADINIIDLQKID